MKAFFLFLVTVNLLYGATCVRGGYVVYDAFCRNNANETVYDSDRDLSYQDDEAAMTVEKPWLTYNNNITGHYEDTSGDTAATYCEQLVFAGVDDWYLPTLTELNSTVVDNFKYPHPLIDGAFKNTALAGYWTSSSRYPTEYMPQTWVVNFALAVTYSKPMDEYHNVRCARKGKIVNSAATSISLSSNTIDENQPSGTTVGKLSATDADLRDTQTYTLACATPGADDGSFDINGTALKSAAVFDFESKASYSICIRATDSFALTYDQNVTITVTDVAHFSRDDLIETVYESDTNLTWEDNGTYPKLNWSDAQTYCSDLVFAGVNDWYLPTLSQLRSTVDTNNYPRMDAAFANPYPAFFWSSTSYNTASAWGVQFYDASEQRMDKSYSMSVRCVRDGQIPHFPASDINITSTTVGDNLPAGTVVGTLAAADSDIGDTNTFALACAIPGADDGSFAISGSTLQSAAVFDAQVKSSYSICVRATDSYGLTLDKNMTINVLVNSQTNADGSTTSAFFNIRDAMTYTDSDGNIVTEGTAQTSDGRDVRVVVTTYPDGTAEYRVYYDASGGESDAHFDIPGAQTVVGDDANVTSTLSPAAVADVNGTKVQVIVTTDNEGNSTSRYVATDANNTQTTSWTADETTPFAPGNTIRVYEQNGTLDIQVKTKLTGTIKF